MNRVLNFIVPARSERQWIAGRLIPAVLFCLLATAALGQESDTGPANETGGQVIFIVEQLSQLLRNGNTEEAWQLAEENRRELEGEPAFDALYARAALNMGEYQRASFALERTLMLYPDYHGVRLTLVEAYLGMGNTEAAGRQLERLGQAELNDGQQELLASLSNVRDQMVLRNQTQSTVFTSAQTFYNTNINNGLTCSDCNIDEYNFDASRSEGAPGVSLQARYDRSTPISQQVSRNFQFGGHLRLSTHSDANAASAQAGFGHQRNDLGRYDLMVSPSWNDDGLAWYGSGNGRLFDVLSSIDATTSISLNTSASGTNSVTLTGGATDSAEYLPGLQGTWQTGTLVGIGESELDHYWGVNGGIQASVPPFNNWNVQGGFNYQWERYLNRQVGDGKPMVNNSDIVVNHVISSSLSLVRPLQNELQLSSSVSWRHIVSNDLLMETGGLEIALGVQRAW